MKSALGLALIGLVGVGGMVRGASVPGGFSGRGLLLPGPRAGEEAGGAAGGAEGAGAGGAAEGSEPEVLSMSELLTKSGEPAPDPAAEAAAKAEAEKAAAEGSGGGEDLAAKLAALEAEKTTLAAELETQRKTASDLQAQQEAARAQVALRSDFEREKGAELDALDEAVLAGEMTEAEAEARGAQIAKDWKAARDSQSELTKLKTELEVLKGEKAKTEALAQVQKLIADSPEMKVGGEAAQKFILDAVLEGKDAAAAFAQVTAMIQSVAGAAVEAQKVRDAAAAAAGPNISGGAPAAGAGDEPEVLTFTQLAEKAMAWRPV